MIMMTILTELHSIRIWFYSSKIEALFLTLDTYLYR